MGLNQLFQAVSRLIPSGARTPQPPRMYAAQKLDYVRFKVTDEDTAQKLADWHARDRAARTAIETYLDKTFPSSRCATGTYYRIDDDGYLKDVAYNGFVPEGWHAQADEDHDRTYHWVEPKDSQVMRIITQMPPAPSRRALADIVGWPYLEVAGQAEDQAMLYQSVNHTLRTQDDAGGVLLDVPLCDNFNAHTEVRETLGAWRVPRYLQPSMLLSPPRGLRFRPLKIAIPAGF